MFWADTSVNGKMERNAIAHIYIAPRIHPAETKFRRAYDCNPYVSILFWVDRLVILEYVLPLNAQPFKSHGRIGWPIQIKPSDRANTSGWNISGEVNWPLLDTGPIPHGRTIVRQAPASLVVAKRSELKCGFSCDKPRILSVIIFSLRPHKAIIQCGQKARICGHSRDSYWR